MAWEFSLLVVANVTAGSDELIDCLRERAAQGACRFTLVMPASGADAPARLEEALELMRAAVLENVEGIVGDPVPVVAVMEAWDPLRFANTFSTSSRGTWATRRARSTTTSG